MRTEQEMIDLILQFAQKDERIRAVILEGSHIWLSGRAKTEDVIL